MARSSANIVGEGGKGHNQSSYTEVLLYRLLKNHDTISYGMAAHLPRRQNPTREGGLGSIFQPFPFQLSGIIQFGGPHLSMGSLKLTTEASLGENSWRVY